ncbi:hypothetical protein F2Q69_00009951 [Brassica cretica]|uniref:Uncharacterized protein n=1 Tax=Brassica cretica TaxID=69181 RepID=A0A8S9PJH8_BRACR|nr:hypothetical protein F2Q69_00009951 [Brassica cretica]
MLPNPKYYKPQITHRIQGHELKIPSKEREERESRSQCWVRRTAGASVRAVAGARRLSSLSLNYPIFVSSPSPPASALSKLWPTTTRSVSDLGVKTRLLGCYGAVKTLVVWVPIPGGGGSHSSVAAGSCVQEVEASSVSPSSALVSGGVGALTLSDEISKSDEALRRVDRVGRTEVVSAEALRVLSFDEMKLR